MVSIAQRSASYRSVDAVLVSADAVSAGRDVGAIQVEAALGHHPEAHGAAGAAAAAVVVVQDEAVGVGVVGRGVAAPERGECEPVAPLLRACSQLVALSEIYPTHMLVFLSIKRNIYQIFKFD